MIKKSTNSLEALNVDTITTQFDGKLENVETLLKVIFLGFELYEQRGGSRSIHVSVRLGFVCIQQTIQKNSTGHHFHSFYIISVIQRGWKKDYGIISLYLSFHLSSLLCWRFGAFSSNKKGINLAYSLLTLHS